MTRSSRKKISKKNFDLLKTPFLGLLFMPLKSTKTVKVLKLNTGSKILQTHQFFTDFYHRGFDFLYFKGQFGFVFSGLIAVLNQLILMFLEVK